MDFMLKTMDFMTNGEGILGPFVAFVTIIIISAVQTALISERAVASTTVCATCPARMEFIIFRPKSIIFRPKSIILCRKSIIFTKRSPIISQNCG